MMKKQIDLNFFSAFIRSKQFKGEAYISLFLMLMIFTSRLSLSIKSISLVVSLILIVLIIPFKQILKTAWQNPIARVAALLYAFFIFGTLYGHAPLPEKMHVLKSYLPLLWISFLMAFFQASFPELSKRFTTEKIKTYTSVYVYGVILTAFLGCLNAWHLVDIVGLVHNHPITDPPEYPFGTFSFSISFAAYLSVQKMRYATNRRLYYRYLACFVFLSFFIFFVNHQRTAYILYVVLLLFYGYQHLKLKGLVSISILLAFLALGAFVLSPTFQTRTSAVVHDIQIYKQGDPVSSTGLRLFFLKASYDLWKKEPLLGYGTGSFKSTYLTIEGYNISGGKNTPETALDQPHSDYAYILVQLGLIGFMFFIWLLLKQFFLAFELPVFERQCAQAFIVSFMLGALDTTLLFYATSITDYFFFSALFYANIRR